MKPAEKKVHMWDVLGLPADKRNPPEDIQAVPQQEQHPSAASPPMETPPMEKPPVKEEERRLG